MFRNASLVVLVLLGTTFFVAHIALAQPSDTAEPVSRAERSGFTETSRYQDVLDFFAVLNEGSEGIQLRSLGKSYEGRDIPLIVLSDQPIVHPGDARTLGRPVILLLANIHGGEVEGKEAIQHLCRRLLKGDLQEMLKHLTILCIPIYNVDGNERISTDNRSEQYGPIHGVGIRENGQRLDLNRDFMKLDSPEARALVKLFNEWDPHVQMDLHTTNGSYHGYHLTYSHSLHPDTDAAILNFQRQQMMPRLANAMRENHGLRTYYYGNFTGFSRQPRQGERTTWEAFTWQPRIGQNYGGLRNRLTVLSEAYSYLSFRRRVEVTEKFVEEVLRFCISESSSITEITDAADRQGNALLTTECIAAALDQPVDILVGEVETVTNPISGKSMLAMRENVFTPLQMEDFGQFQPVKSTSVPKAYLLPSETAIIEKLQQHGIEWTELPVEQTWKVDRFVVTEVNRNERSFQGHHETRISGQLVREEGGFPAGTIRVDVAQPLGRLVCALLDPESTDGLVTWNFFDPWIRMGQPLPIAKLPRESD
jgi:hypothetical protein